jgi:hypothetical protein
MRKMQKVRQLTLQVKSGALTFNQGYNKLLCAIKSADSVEIQAYISNFMLLCA